MPAKICRDCKGPLIKRLRVGYVDQCDRCGTLAEKDVKRSVGLIGGASCGKSNVITIFREPSDTTIGRVKSINGGRYHAGHGMPLGNPNGK